MKKGGKNIFQVFKVWLRPLVPKDLLNLSYNTLWKSSGCQTPEVT